VTSFIDDYYGSIVTVCDRTYNVVAGSCRQKRQLLRQKIVEEQRRLLGKAATSQHKCDIKEHSSSTTVADDDSLLLSDVETGL